MELSYNFFKKVFLIFQEKYIQNSSIFRTRSIFKTRRIFRTLSSIYDGMFCKNSFLPHFLRPNSKNRKSSYFFLYFGKSNFLALRENTEKYIIFAVSLEKEVTRIDKNGGKITKNISYILQFIDSARYLVKSLLNLVNNLSEVIHRIKCKFEMIIKNVKLAELNINIATVFLNIQSFRVI